MVQRGKGCCGNAYMKRRKRRGESGKGKGPSASRGMMGKRCPSGEGNSGVSKKGGGKKPPMEGEQIHFFKGVDTS